MLPSAAARRFWRRTAILLRSVRLAVNSGEKNLHCACITPASAVISRWDLFGLMGETPALEAQTSATTVGNVLPVVEPPSEARLTLGRRPWPESAVAAAWQAGPSWRPGNYPANRSHACAMWARVTRASGSPNARAIFKHRCARRRYSSALLATTPLPIRPVGDKRRRLELVRSAGGVHGWSGGTDVCLRGVADGCVALARDAMSMRRPRRARCMPMVGGRLKGSPCLRRAGERHTLVNALGRTSYTPKPKVPPRDFGTPLSRRPNPMPWAGFSLPVAGAGPPSPILGSDGLRAAQPS
jgi:hypothetical protein